MPAALPFDNSFSQLPDRFYSRLAPTPVSAPELIKVNETLAALLNIDVAWLKSAEGIQTIAGNHIPDGAEPLASVYAGHQFGNWNPQLGDGRAILLGEVIGTDGNRYDVQLKGSGPTPYSRGGDGRAPLGPVLREYLVSEAMAALGVPTSRTLAAVTTGEEVYREEVMPGGVLARVASSHIRIGTFQYFASIGDNEGIKVLADHVINRHYPGARTEENPYLALFAAVARKQAELIAHWQSIGFIHGVMNTDNMLLCGETIDYGPCAFMDAYDPGKVFSSIDQGGRYAYQNQPGIGQWNLACLAQALLPLFGEDQDASIEAAKAILDDYLENYHEIYWGRMATKFGFKAVAEHEMTLMQSFLALLTEAEADFTLAFRRLSDLADPKNETQSIAAHFDFDERFMQWLEGWQKVLAEDNRSPDTVQQNMYLINPAFIPRNHWVEQVIANAVVENDLTLFHEWYDVLQSPFTYDAASSRFAEAPLADQEVKRTFCGT